MQRRIQILPFKLVMSTIIMITLQKINNPRCSLKTLSSTLISLPRKTSLEPRGKPLATLCNSISNDEVRSWSLRIVQRYVSSYLRAAMDVSRRSLSHSTLKLNQVSARQDRELLYKRPALVRYRMLQSSLQTMFLLTTTARAALVNRLWRNACLEARQANVLRQLLRIDS